MEPLIIFSNLAFNSSIFLFYSSFSYFKVIFSFSHVYFSFLRFFNSATVSLKFFFLFFFDSFLFKCFLCSLQPALLLLFICLFNSFKLLKAVGTPFFPFNSQFSTGHLNFLSFSYFSFILYS